MPTCSKCLCKAKYIVRGVLFCGRCCKLSNRIEENQISNLIQDTIDSIYSGSPSLRRRMALEQSPISYSPATQSYSSTCREAVVIEKHDASTEFSPQHNVARCLNDTSSSPIIFKQINNQANNGTSPISNNIDTASSPINLQDNPDNLNNIEEIGLEGKIIMTGNLPSEPKYLHIYLSPNALAPQKNTIYLLSLSPENLGPILLPNRETCINLENLWEFSKVAKSLVTKEEENTIKKEYYDLRKIGFEDGNYQYYLEDDRNELAFFLFKDKYGKERRFTPLGAKFFFCHYYEMLVKNKPDFIRLKTFKEEKFNIQIAGNLFINERKTPIEYYIQDRENFDEAMVLYCMLTIENENNYPWRSALKFEDLYKDMI
jgi:hypothetical protein